MPNVFHTKSQGLPRDLYSLEIQNKVSTLKSHIPEFTKECLASDVDLLKRISKFGKDENLAEVKSECSWRTKIFKLFSTDLMQRQSTLLPNLYQKLNRKESCVEILVENRDEIGSDFYRNSFTTTTV